jgi:hypothetical protein
VGEGGSNERSEFEMGEGFYPAIRRTTLHRIVCNANAGDAAFNEGIRAFLEKRKPVYIRR